MDRKNSGALFGSLSLQLQREGARQSGNLKVLGHIANRAGAGVSASAKQITPIPGNIAKKESAFTSARNARVVDKVVRNNPSVSFGIRIK